MPDHDGKIRGISVPDVPWCRKCGLVRCVCMVEISRAEMEWAREELERLRKLRS